MFSIQGGWRNKKALNSIMRDGRVCESALPDLEKLSDGATCRSESSERKALSYKEVRVIVYLLFFSGAALRWLLRLPTSGL